MLISPGKTDCISKFEVLAEGRDETGCVGVAARARGDRSW